MVRHLLILGAFAGWVTVSLSGCRDEPPARVVNYYAINTTPSPPYTGIISSLYSTGETEPEAFKMDVAPGQQDRIIDALLAGDKIYCARAFIRSIDVLDASNLSVIQSLPYGKSNSPYVYKHIELVNNKIIVSDLGYDYPEPPGAPKGYPAFLKAINVDNGKVDSIPVIDHGEIIAVAQTHGKIVVAAHDFVTYFIKIFDGTTYSKIAEINLGVERCDELLIDRDGNILVRLWNFKILKLSQSNLSVLAEKQTGGGALSYSLPNSSMIALDRDANVLYYFSLNGFHVPEFLSYDLNNDIEKSISQNVTTSITTLSFDQKNKLVVVGDIDNQGGVAKIYTTNGELKNQFHFPSAPSEFLVK